MTPIEIIQKAALVFEALAHKRTPDGTMLGMTAMCLRALRDSEDPDMVVAVAEIFGYAE